MLRLLQKRFREQPDFIHYALFVVTIHGLLCVLLFGSLRDNPLHITIKRHHASHVRVTWRDFKNTEHTAKVNANRSVTVAEKPVQPARQKIKKAAPLSVGQAKLKHVKRLTAIPPVTTINLGPKKKKKKPAPVIPAQHAMPQASSMPAPISPITVEPVEEKTVILSMHEHQQEQELFEIIDAVRRWWQPPLGASPDAQCAIKVKISHEGEVQGVVVEQSSGIRAYDIAAKSALLKSIFPKKIWGKECVFQF